MTNVPRPPLPVQCFNQRIKDLKDGSVPTVKFQRINREKKEVLVGRVKVATPNNGHAFILRRFDTGAVSITTLFRAAFPTASEQAERDEISWVAHSYDLTGANGGVDPDRVRFSGRWAGPQVASMLAEHYGLGTIVQALLAAKVEDASVPQGNKITAGRTPATPAGKGGNNAPATPSSNGPPANKRRKEEPVPAQAQAQNVQATPQRSPAKRGRTAQSPAPAPAPAVSTTPAAPPPRRSTRTRATRSPSVGPPASQAPTTRARSNTPSRTSPRKPNSRKGAIPNMGSDETMVGSDAFGSKGPSVSAVHEQDEEEEDEEAEYAVRPNYEEDVAEQKSLIQGLKAARERNLAQYEGAEADADAKKRAREEESKTMRFDFKEPEVEERALVANSRTRGRIERLEPQQKSALWGSLALAVGFGAATLLPNLWF